MFILFKKDLFEKIIDNTKTSTLRKNITYKVNDVLSARCGRASIKIKVKSIEKISIDSINDEILKNEGIKTIKELKEILFQCYNKTIENLFYVQFIKI